jgi:threonine/homoserine/homoserine lactone efflux protein
MNTLFQSYFPVDILELIIKGMIIGMAASAPMGPVGILCVQRTQKKGRWYGFVTGVGAAVSDFIYALITGIGLSFVLDFINNPVYKFYFQLAGGVMLLVFGLYSFLNNPLRNAHKGGQKSTGSLWYNCWTGFLITFSNPLIVLLFMALFSMFNFVVPNHPLAMCGGFASIIGGAVLWWYGLTWLVDKIRAKWDLQGVVIINRIIGSLVILFSLITLIGTIFNIYLFPISNGH